MSEMDNIFIWAGRPYVSLADHQSALDATRKEAMMEGVKEGMRIAASVPIEHVPAAIDAALSARLAEVEAERDAVEKMRDGILKVIAVSNGALDLTATEATLRRDLIRVREDLRDIIWPP